MNEPRTERNATSRRTRNDSETSVEKYGYMLDNQKIDRLKPKT